LQVVNLECSFLGRPNQSPFDTLLHSRHEDLVPELLPALLGVVHGHDRPTTGRRTGGVEFSTFNFVLAQHLIEEVGKDPIAASLKEQIVARRCRTDLDGKLAVSGAQPADVLLGALDRAWRELCAPEIVPIVEGAVCGPDGCD